MSAASSPGTIKRSTAQRPAKQHGSVQRVRNGTVELAVESLGLGPALVVGHGLSGNRHVSLEQFTPVRDMYRLVAFDQRGHGDSTPLTDLAAYDPQAMADDIAAVLDGLELRRAVVAGESMGAVGAVLFALQHPERVDKLLLTGPAFGDSLNARRPWLREVGEDFLADGLEPYLAAFGHRLRDELGVEEHIIASLLAVYRSHDPASLGTAFLATSDWIPFPDLTVMAELSVPVSIVAWDDDDLHPIALARTMAEHIPDATLAQIPALLDMLTDPTVAGRVHRRFLMEH